MQQIGEKCREKKWEYFCWPNVTRRGKTRRVTFHSSYTPFLYRDRTVRMFPTVTSGSFATISLLTKWRVDQADDFQRFWRRFVFLLGTRTARFFCRSAGRKLVVVPACRLRDWSTVLPTVSGDVCRNSLSGPAMAGLVKLQLSITLDARTTVSQQYAGSPVRSWASRSS